MKGSHSVEIIYLAQFVDPIERIRLNPEDHSEYGWYADREIEPLFTGTKTADDSEVLAIRRGFEKLRMSQRGHDRGTAL